MIARIVRDFARDIVRDRAGNILPIAAVGVLIAAIVVGSAVDLSRNYLIREQIQSACDAAVLAGRRTVTTAGFDKASKDAAAAYFATNFNDASQGTRSTVFNATSDDDGQSVTATASTVLDTLIMRIFGKNSFDISVTCASAMGVGNSDVMLVLDTTGSMDFTLSGSQTRIQALRAAMKNFYNTIYKATAASNARVRYGFVPFSSTVNVGRLLNDLDTRYIVDNYDYQSREWTNYSTTYSSTITGGWTTYSTTGYNSSDCNSAIASLNNAGAWGDNGSATTVNSNDIQTISQPQRQTVYRCTLFNSKYYIQYQQSDRTMYSYYRYVYKQRTYATNVFKGFSQVSTQTGSYGGNVNSTWGGCIQERGTVNQATFSYSSDTGITPKAALDLDLDGVPNVNDDNTKWKPLWPEISYTRYDYNKWGQSSYTTNESYYGNAGGSYCPVQARLLATMSQSAFNAYTDSLQAVGGTYLDIGMIWGGRLMSPQGMWKGLVNDDPDNGGKVARHIIFMTDGEMEPSYQIPQAWGMEYWDRRVTADGYSNDEARHTSRFLATCAAIKDKGIRIWVIAFTSGLSNDLKTCASDDSSYTASSSGELNTAFQEIAKNVGELKMVK